MFESTQRPLPSCSVPPLPQETHGLHTHTPPGELKGLAWLTGSRRQWGGFGLGWEHPCPPPGASCKSAGRPSQASGRAEEQALPAQGKQIGGK